MKINYIVPSYKRAKGITTLDYITEAKALIAPEEYEEYRKYHPEWGEERFIVVPEGIQGNGKSRALNWMLDNLWDGYDAIVHLDDDIHCYYAHEKDQKDRKLEEWEVYDVFERACILAKDWGCGIWGLNINSDPLSYDEFKPFRTLAYIDGGTVGYVRQMKSRYDEELTIKEDVDFFLQNLVEFGKALRIEKYWINKESFTNEGGCNVFRSSEEEQRQFVMMQKKWGSNIIRPNKPTAKKNSKIRGLGGAIRLNLPLKGV